MVLKSRESMAKAATGRVSPELTALQFAPPSVLLKTPEGVAAYNIKGFRGSIASALT